MPAARTPGARSRSTAGTASCSSRPARQRTISTAPIAPANNLFGNCLLALDARTGKRLWHFQTVHHDLWDYDLTAAPKLLTVRHNGKTVEIVAQAGKTGFLYVFERLTGKPLWPIEERPVPKSDVPGEVSSPTQPFPTKPAPFARQVFTPEDVNPFVSPEEQEKLRQAVRDAANEGVFSPSSHLRHHIQFPGAWGGANWGSMAADPGDGHALRAQPGDAELSPDGAQRRSVRAAPAIMGGHAGTGWLRGLRADLRRHVTAPVRRRCDRRRSSAPDGFRPADSSGEGTDAGVLRKRCCRRTVVDAARSVSAQPAARRCRPGVQWRRMLRLPPNPNRYSGPATRYAGSFSAGWYTSNGLPAVGPPWTQLVAYDLNDGTIKWRVPDGQAPGLADKGIPLTGTRAAAKRSGRDGRWTRLRRQLTGSDAARLRPGHRQGDLGPRARGEPGGHSRGLPGRRAASTSPLRPARRGARAPIRCGRTRSTGSRRGSRRRDTTYSGCR